MITLGSLFDGIAGFPEAARRCGIVTVWASEIREFMMRVSSQHFPDMKHKGDIKELHGEDLEPVDVVSGGSPCQDLSNAGLKEGIHGERSGLFFEQIRVIKEMRDHDKRNGRTGIHIRPRFMLWENVAGAFSSNKGKDFQRVLQEIAQICSPGIVIPGCPSGKWNTAGVIMGNGWSIAWRVLDSQYWGVPQRRRRIYLIADFGGNTAPEILFKREGLSRHTEKSGEKRKGTSSDSESGTGKAIAYSFDSLSSNSMKSDNPTSGCREVDIAKCLDTTYPCPSKNQGGIAIVEPIAIDSNCQDIRFSLSGGIVPTIPAKAGTGGNNGPMLAIPIHDQATRHSGKRADKMDGKGNGIGVGKDGDPAYTLTTADRHAVCAGFNGHKSVTGNICYHEERIPAMESKMPGNVLCTPDSISGTVTAKWKKGTGGPSGDEYQNLIVSEVAHCLRAKHSLAHRDDSDNLVLTSEYIVRRVTPLECERLQDFDDGWTDIPGCNDSIRYEALGNSVSVCCPEYIFEGIVEVLERGN